MAGILLFIFLFTAFTFFVIGLGVGRQKIEKDAIKKGKAQYNPKTKEFEWL